MSARLLPLITATGQSAASDFERRGGTGHQSRGGGIVDDLGHGSVEVQQHHGLSRLGERSDLTVGVERIGHGGDSLVAVQHRHSGEVGNHYVGSASKQLVSVAAAVDTDNQPEAAVVSCRHACQGILDDGAPLGMHTQPLRRLDQDGGVGLSRKLQVAGEKTVHPDREQVSDARSLQDLFTVAAG